MIAINEKPRWFFYPEWVFLNVFAVVIAAVTAWGLVSLVVNIVGDTIQVGGQIHITEDFLLLYVLLPLIGLLTGLAQYVLLQRYLSRMSWWVAATFLGWSMPFIIRSLSMKFLAPGNGTFLIMLGMLLVGAAIALPQWWMLRQRVPHASWWIIAYAFGWWTIGLLNLVTSDPFTVLLAIALIPSIATGIACWFLLDRSPKDGLKGSVPSY